MIRAISFVFNEHKENLYRIWQLGKYHMQKQTIRTSLGIGWIFIHDLIYFAVFTIFRYLMAGSAQVEGMNFIVFLITGLVPWFFMSEVINNGSNAIKMNQAIISSIKFPITVIPTIEVMAIFLKRLFTLLVAFGISIGFGYLSSFRPLLFLYYFFSMLILMILFNLIISAFVAISDDFNQLYLSIVRVIFFSMPIIWSFETITGLPWAIYILKLNPMVYIISGFRDAFVLGNAPDLQYTVYFWVLCLIMFAAGSMIQYRLRKYYSDFI
ncbi:MAG: ABC transporter permease [Clostridia bacterium]|nr:ABC transporter permease [Clostridia bacterium]MBN2883540.1 ABC transporter permease [Clostridia bacterium]